MSDHRPIITSLGYQLEPEEQLKRSWNFRKANWDSFTSSLDELCRNAPTHTDLDHKLQTLNKNITLAAKKNIPRGKRKKHWIPFWKEAEIDTLIKERDDAHDHMKINNTAENRAKLCELSKRVEEKIAECKRQKWSEFCSTLD
ncbi:hypothetical protein JTE90_003556 [Oedothorax gibbosus]|uniref:Endonuclease/exonuclease/phosphatase domain-containing protein n=1 Tax=Oedothorax gibbosus TaxID=931172 RepID=A0AAV6VKV9_9ARAC|nr:hypothetical protein JTE90_003556 [Oedothorax gibbosus]